MQYDQIVNGRNLRMPNAVITIAIRLRYDYNVSHTPASNSTQAENEHVNFSS